jgi:Uma2 family endonuclease
MAVETLVSVEEYLNASYEPDMEYVDGVLVERNVGESWHSWVQRNILVALSVKYPHVFPFPEFRGRTRATRYRIPDICVTLSAPKTRVLTEAAFIAVEILSPDDRISRFVDRLKEFEALGTRHIWVVDPETRELFIFTDGNLLEVKGDVLASDNPRLELTRGEIFKDLDKLA